jgi:hypothetical protein
MGVILDHLDPTLRVLERLEAKAEIVNGDHDISGSRLSWETGCREQRVVGVGEELDPGGSDAGTDRLTKVRR